MIEIQAVDFTNDDQSQHLVDLLDHYARDPMGGGEPLSNECRESLATCLAKLPHAISFIVYVDGTPAALANCFEAFSTFKCRPLINIHDLVVHAAFRGMGLSQKLLDHIAGYAKEKGCCKVTLEVLSGNDVAIQAYSKFGFEDYALDPEAGSAKFMELVL